jgi:hypothetical protein
MGQPRAALITETRSRKRVSVKVSYRYRTMYVTHPVNAVGDLIDETRWDFAWTSRTGCAIEENLSRDAAEGPPRTKAPSLPTRPMASFLVVVMLPPQCGSRRIEPASLGAGHRRANDSDSPLMTGDDVAPAFATCAVGR